MQGVHYQRLGVAPTATPEEIRTAYRNLARVHHPDKHEGKTSTRMLEINEAWRVLSDPVLRYKYDADLRAHRNEVNEDEALQRRERLQNIALTPIFVITRQQSFRGSSLSVSLFWEPS